MVLVGCTVDGGAWQWTVVVVVWAGGGLVVVGGGPVVVGAGVTGAALGWPCGPGRPCAPGGPGGPVPVIAVVTDGVVVGAGPPDDGGGWVTVGSVVDVTGGRVAVAITVEATALAASRPAPTHHNRAVDRAWRARTKPIRRLTLMTPAGRGPAARP